MKADAGSEPPAKTAPKQPKVACDLCGRVSSDWTEWTARTVWNAAGGRYANPQIHHLRVCSRCSLVWDGGEALGALLLFLSIAMLFSAFINWPKFLWAWDPRHLGTPTGTLIFGTMAVGILIWGVFGMQRRIDARALDQRDLPPQPGWGVMTATPETFEGILRTAMADPERDMRYPRVALRGGAVSHVVPEVVTNLEMECRQVISDFLLRDGTRTYEAANNAWWKREDLILTLFKAQLHARVTPDELTAASNAAIDAMAREDLLQGTDSGYRASAKLAASPSATRSALPESRGPAACALCGLVPSSSPVSIIVRRGRLVSADVTNVSRHGDLTVTTMTKRYTNIEDVDVTVCRRCWIEGRVTWRRTLKSILIGLPVALLLGLWAIIYGIEGALLGFASVAVTAVGGLAVFYYSFLWVLAHHPMERIKRMVLASGTSGAAADAIVCTSWPAPRPGTLERGE